MTNKLGFYLHSFEIGPHKGDLFRAIQEIRPPVMLVHAWDQVDQLRRLAPDSLIIGRMTYFGPEKRPVNDLVNGWLESDDPEARGHDFAEHILRDNFGMALRRENGRLLIDAWMSLNEAVPGPASDQYRQQPGEIERRLRAYDAFQVGFRNKLSAQGVEAVAFNFGAGNFASADHYWSFFPRTLATYTYLGFHEYGWPALSTTLEPTAASSAGTYRAIVRELSQRSGRRYEAILTEAGLALMYKYPNSSDKGWLFTPPSELGARAVTQEEYRRSLDWLNDYLGQDDFARGACLFEVGHAGDWETFRHFGQDNAGQPIQIISHIAHLAAEGRGRDSRAATVGRTPPTVTLRGHLVDETGVAINGATIRLIGGAETLGADPRAVVNNRGAVTWTRRLSGFTGSLWNGWQRHVAPHVAGITWEEFRRQAPQINPALRTSDGRLLADQTYFLPENRVFADTRHAAPVIVWDRMVTGFDGDLWRCWQHYVQGKVVGLTKAAFKQGVLAANPSLAGDHGHFAAYKIYALPRTIVAQQRFVPHPSEQGWDKTLLDSDTGAEEYVRLAYTVRAGHFVFANLRPGAYRLEINADGYQPLVHPLILSDDEALTLPLARIALVLTRGADPFIHTLGRQFVLNGRTFRFVGVNLRGLAHYGTDTLPGTHGQQSIQLQAAHELGARVVRIFLPDRNSSVEEIIGRFKALVELMDRNFSDMYLIVALTNLYGDVAFHVPGDADFYHNGILQPEWFRPGGSEHYRRFVERVVKEFKNVPRIMAYNIGNELKAEGQPEVLIDFMHSTAARIAAWDEGHHLISTGMISTRHAWMQHREELRTRLYNTPLLHFITNHAYHGDDDPATNRVQENEAPSREDDADLAEKLGKPLLIEEAGFVGAEDRMPWFTKELNLLLDSGKAAGYMPWGFMAGSDNGDGDKQLGMDHIWHAADWASLGQLLRTRAADLARQAVDVTLPTTAFVTGQQIFAAAGVRLRRPAGLGANIVHQTHQRTLVTVLGAARAKDGLTWWPVRVVLGDSQIEEGWIAQTAPSGEVLLSAV